MDPEASEEEREQYTDDLVAPGLFILSVEPGTLVRRHSGSVDRVGKRHDGLHSIRREIIFPSRRWNTEMRPDPFPLLNLLRLLILAGFSRIATDSVLFFEWIRTLSVVIYKGFSMS
jgi:hypothetical protein